MMNMRIDIVDYCVVNINVVNVNYFVSAILTETA